jgi:hypothetical protein
VSWADDLWNGSGWSQTAVTEELQWFKVRLQLAECRSLTGRWFSANVGSVPDLWNAVILPFSRQRENQLCWCMPETCVYIDSGLIWWVFNVLLLTSSSPRAFFVLRFLIISVVSAWLIK